jgi:hypothetical protein
MDKEQYDTPTQNEREMPRPWRSCGVSATDQGQHKAQ